MIKIYSITEILEASNNILSRSKIKNKLNPTKKIKKNKKTLLKKNKPLLLTEEFHEDKIINIDNNDLNKTNKLIDQIYLKFNKKVKKNTLKLIFELHREISELNKKKDLIAILNNKLNKEIDNKIITINDLNNENKKLVNQNKSLNDKLIKLNQKLHVSENQIQSLKENKLKLEYEAKDRNFLEQKTISLSQKLKNSYDEVEVLRKDKIKLDKEISELKAKNETSEKKIYDISEVENKNKFFQEENLRIGSELLEIKRKHDILKKEIEKYETQKSNLISKINSVNEALTDTNILTSVFKNKLENKVNVVDHNKISKKISSDLDEQIKNIFSDNK